MIFLFLTVLFLHGGIVQADRDTDRMGWYQWYQPQPAAARECRRPALIDGDV